MQTAPGDFSWLVRRLGSSTGPRIPMTILFSACYWTFAVGVTLFLFPGALLIWCLTAPFDPTGSLLHR